MQQVYFLLRGSPPGMNPVMEVPSRCWPPWCGYGWVGKGTQWIPHQLSESYISLAKASHVATCYCTEASNLQWSQKERWTRRFVENPKDYCSTQEVFVNECSRISFYLTTGMKTSKTHTSFLPKAWKNPEQRDSYTREYIFMPTMWIPIVCPESEGNSFLSSKEWF